MIKFKRKSKINFVSMISLIFFKKKSKSIIKANNI